MVRVLFPSSLRGRLTRWNRIEKGTPIVISILAINRDKSLWGEDSFEFKCAVPPLTDRAQQLTPTPTQARTLGQSPRSRLEHPRHLGE